MTETSDRGSRPDLDAWRTAISLPAQGITTPYLAVVEEFSEHTGLGSIRIADLVFPFHCVAVSDGSRSVSVGAGVVVRLGTSIAGGYQATTVVKI